MCSFLTVFPFWSNTWVDPPSLTDKQILIKYRIDDYAITNLPKKSLKVILVDAARLDGKSSVEACFDVERMRGHLINSLTKNKFSNHSRKFHSI